MTHLQWVILQMALQWKLHSWFIHARFTDCWRGRAPTYAFQHISWQLTATVMRLAAFIQGPSVRCTLKDCVCLDERHILYLFRSVMIYNMEESFALDLVFKSFPTPFWHLSLLVF